MRAWLVLSRVSNLPTVWTNTLAGGVIAGGAVDDRMAAAAVAISSLYVGGMVLNDVCDVHHDRAQRPTRPIPAGHISVEYASRAAVGLMSAGVLIAAVYSPRLETLAWAAGLALAITLYNLRHKGNPAAPLVMGICRGLVYCVVASMVTGAVPGLVLVAASAMAAYVAGFTLAARRVPAVRPAVSWCIAAISLVDAGALGAVGAYGAAAVAAAGMPLTLLLQRWVPGD